MDRKTGILSVSLDIIVLRVQVEYSQYTMSEFKIRESTLVVDGGRIEFAAPIETVVAHESRYLVLLDSMGLPPDRIHRNIIACDETGSRLWTVEAAPNGGTGDNPFVELAVADAGVVAHTWTGQVVLLDGATGHWEPHDYTK